MGACLWSLVYVQILCSVFTTEVGAWFFARGEIALCLGIFTLICTEIQGKTASSSLIDETQKKFWTWRMKHSPSYSTYLGVYDNNDIMRSFNVSMFEVRKNDIQKFLESLLDVKRKELTNPEYVNYLILKDTFQTYIDGYEYANYGALNPMNFLEGIQRYHSVVMATTKTRGDFENYIARLNALPQQLAEIEESFREAMRMNRTYHNVSMIGVLPQLDNMIVNDTTKSPFYYVFNETLESSNIPEADRIDVLSRGHDALRVASDAFKKFKTFIVEEYMPKTRPNIGVSSQENGREYYKACLKWHLSFEMSPEEVHQQGLSEVERIHGEMQKIIQKEVGEKLSVKEFFDSLVNDSRFYTNDREKILQNYRDIVNNRINPHLPKYFKNIPDVPLEIRAMEYDGPGGGYSSATETRPGYFSVNIIRPMELPSFDFMALSLHEANPGHHLQHSYAMKASLPDYRRHSEISFYDVPFWFPFYSAYSEGWGLYSEYLGVEMGLYKDDYEMMGRYSAEILRACRLVVDTGMHFFGWERERAIEYMLNYTAASRESTATEVDRYITWPGQACAYKIGEIKIKNLRSHAENELGVKFDIKDFHSVILENGAMPMSVMETLINEWITEKKNEPHQTSSATYNMMAQVLFIFIGTNLIGTF